MEKRNLNKALQESGENIVAKLRDGLAKHNLKSSNLSKNIKYKIVNDKIIISMPEYGLYLDQGTKPHMPPVKEIEKWANSKNLNAWAVAQNINKFGTKAKHFILSSDEIDKEIKNNIAIAFGKDIKMEADEMFKKLNNKK